MPGVFKRKSDAERGKDGKYTCWWTGVDGKQKTKVGFTDKKESLNYARGMEVKCRLSREGVTDQDEQARKDLATEPIGKSLADYRKALDSKQNTEKHNVQTIKSIGDIFDLAKVESISDLVPDHIHVAVAKLRKVRSTRTANYALAAVKAFVQWLEDTDRIKKAPKGFRRLEAYPAKLDIRHARRALAEGELERLLDAAENGPPRVKKKGTSGGPIIDSLSGSDRAMLYRLAMATGFRANELRQLTPEDFKLDGKNPTITCRARNSKRGKKSGEDDVQPIRRDMAETFKPFLVGKEPGKPVVFVPYRTAQMIRADLKAAGIPYRDSEGRVLDFHALRVSYITNLGRSGMNIKEVQTLARHSDINLTINTYSIMNDDEIRAALERSGDPFGRPSSQPDGRPADPESGPENP